MICITRSPSPEFPGLVLRRSHYGFSPLRTTPSADSGSPRRPRRSPKGEDGRGTSWLFSTRNRRIYVMQLVTFGLRIVLHPCPFLHPPPHIRQSDPLTRSTLFARPVYSIPASSPLPSRGYSCLPLPSLNISPVKIFDRMNRMGGY